MWTMQEVEGFIQSSVQFHCWSSPIVGPVPLLDWVFKDVVLVISQRILIPAQQ